jgi:hypothetical protein
MRRVADAGRRLDTRHRIQLGGLVIKAGLAGEEPAVLLAILTAAPPPPETRFSEIRLCFFTIIRYDLRARPGVLR